MAKNKDHNENGSYTQRNHHTNTPTKFRNKKKYYFDVKLQYLYSHLAPTATSTTRAMYIP